MKKRIFLKRLIWVPIIVSLLFGCGGKGKDLKKIEGDPETLYKQGLARFNKRDYPEALKKFEELKSSFPDSPPYTVWAELKVGDCHFLKKQYVEAIAAYEEFKKIHPSHEEIPYVQFQIGMSYFNQMLTLDRDQTPTKKALSSFEYLIAGYPPSLFTEKAREKVAICKKRLADHEFYIGNFYYKHGRFEAAASRFEGLLEKFPKVPGEDKTLYLLGKSYIELDQWKKAEAAFRKMVTEYPGSPRAEEAKEILDKGLAEMEASHRKTEVTNKKDEGAAIEPDKIALIKFEEEGKQPVSLEEEKRIDLRKEGERSTSLAVTDEPVKAIPPKKEETKKPVSPPAIEPIQEDRAPAIPPSVETNKLEPVLPVEPMKEDRVQLSLPLPSPDTASKVEVKPDEEKRVAVFPGAPALSKEKENVNKKALPETNEAKFADRVDRGQPIDVTSDKVEAYWKENLVIFKGNVIARQKDMVIYADSLEVVTHEDGKGIERVTAGGNVKIQQGLRVANCQKAVFYNLDQKLVLTGDPKVSEGDNIVLGDEIIFHIDKNRVEIKGGPSGRGKAKVQPGEIEKLK
ncbi:MAG: lipopolysaccharide transport periplasmic protein LptA [Deltaproteobacteria bacterium RBG_16_47_11]|nr:MAG: lipopolysaccharide transport periplasmic protein LptA [Deltaproteobacteria bacterium RBG_16_47_11]